MSEKSLMATTNKYLDIAAVTTILVVVYPLVLIVSVLLAAIGVLHQIAKESELWMHMR